MPSSYTQTGIELIATGEQSGTWGTTTNTNLEIIDRLTNGVGSIALSGTTHTLTTTDGVLSDGQYRVLVFGGSPSGTNTVTISPNDTQHLYFVKNGSGQSVVLSQGSGTTVTVANGKSAIVYSDGGGASANVVDLTSTFNFQPLTATLTAIGALSVTDGNIIVGNGSTWVAESNATARASLGLVIGTDVQAYDAGLQSISGLTTSANQMIYTTASDTYATTGLTAAGRAILDDADASAQRTTLGLGTIATQAANNVSITGGSITGITDLAVADGGTGASDAATARTNLGLAIGTNVQAYDAGLQSISGLTTSSDQMIYTTASDTYATTSLTAAGRAILDDADASAQRTTLGLAIGTNVQAYDADLDALAALATNGMIARTGAGTVAARTITAGTGISITDGDGVSGNPTITSSVTSGMSFIASADASSSSSLDFTGFDSSTYDAYLFVFANLIPATDGAVLYARTSTDGGSTYATSSYAGILYYSFFDGSYGSLQPLADVTAAIRITNANGNAAGEDGASGSLLLPMPHLTKKKRILIQSQSEDGSGREIYCTGGYQPSTTSAINGLRFLMSTGNITSGTVTMYGLKNA